jgi:hypothetical protein
MKKHDFDGGCSTRGGGRRAYSIFTGKPQISDCRLENVIKWFFDVQFVKSELAHTGTA